MEFGFLFIEPGLLRGRGQYMAPIFFIHIPKTGGTTIRSCLETDQRTAPICPWYDERDFLTSTEDLYEFRTFVAHVPYFVSNLLPKHCFKFTVLREPISRAISAFKHILREPTHPMHLTTMREAPTLGQFIRHPSLGISLRNTQTRYLGSNLDFARLYKMVRSGGASVPAALGRINEVRRAEANEELLSSALGALELLDYFGLTEHLQLSVNTVFSHLELESIERLPVLNSAPRERADHRVEYSEEDMDLLRAANLYDIKLYEHAKRIYEGNLKRQREN